MVLDTIKANENVGPNTQELGVLKENFPSCFRTDGSFDLERFKEFLSDKVHVVNEGYELKFLGKNYARLLASLDTTTVIIPDEAHNTKSENINSENIYISGDNLDGLKHLLKSYSRKVKCIYIDPPYNTGSDEFGYRDNFNFTPEELSVKLSISIEEATRILDFSKRGSSSHSAWLMFIYPRLLLARNLLSLDGLIFISVDDNESANLKLLCDDVFGEECLLGTFVWKKRQMVDSRTKTGVSKDHDYLYCYGRSTEASLRGKKSDQTKYTNPDEDPRGPWMSADMTGLATEAQRPNLHYTLVNPATGISYTCPPNGWRYDQERMSTLISSGEVLFPPTPSGRPRRKKFLKDIESEYTGVSTFLDLKVYSTQGTRELRNLFDGQKVFDFPKPVDFLSFIFEQSMDENDIVFDFFAGSSTTAHAVMQLNAKDNGKRKYCLIQLPELCKNNSEAYNLGYKTIDQIGIDRILKAANKIKDAYPGIGIDLGFKHFSLAESSQNALDKIELFDVSDDKLFMDENILDSFGRSTVLSTWLVRDGYGLTIEAKKVKFAEYQGYYFDKHLYLIEPNLSDKAIETLVVKFETDKNFNPENIIVFGYSFTWTELEALQTNLSRLRDTEKNLRINIDIRY